MGGGAWPFLVGGVICLVDSDNERDLGLLNSEADHLTGEALESISTGVKAWWSALWRGSLVIPSALLKRTTHGKWVEVQGNNRSVMPLDVLGCTRVTLMASTSFTLGRQVWVIF